jgi:hypothetical protein
LTEIAAALEATALAQFLKGSHWVYPLVNAGHLLGIALLIGAVVPLDLTLAGVLRRVDPAKVTALLRPFVIVGLVLATGFGSLLFITQASDYVRNPMFLSKMGFFAVAALNAALHWRITSANPVAGRLSAIFSLLLWPLILLLGRLVGYSFG